MGAGAGCVAEGGGVMRDEMRIVQVAMGANHALALRENGTVVAWGSNEYGQCNVPAGLVDVVQVDVMAYHSLALTAQRQVVVWGRFLWTNDEYDSVTDNYDTKIKIIDPVTNDIVQLSAGSDHLLMLKNNSSVVVAA